MVLYDLRWMLVLIVVLIIADLWFGISESVKTKIDIRLSRAGRRTCNKLVDYLTYLLIGVVLGLAIFEPLGIATHTTTAAVGLGVGGLWEMDSIIGHVCVLHDMSPRFTLRNFIISIIKRKNKDVADVIEDLVKKKETDE